MKLIISKNGISRELRAPFAMCLGRAELDILIRELQAAYGGMLAKESTYGWIRIDPSHPSDSPPNTPPRPWED